MTMYLLTDDRDRPYGVFDDPSEGMRLVPEARWEPTPDGSPGDFDGWRPNGSYFDRRPHFTVRAVGGTSEAETVETTRG